MSARVTHTRLVVVEAHTLMRVGYLALISAEPDISMVGFAGSVGEAKELIAEHDANVAAVSTVADPGAFDAAVALRSAYPRLGVVVLGMRGDDALFAAIDAGLSACLPATATAGEIVSAIRHAAAAPQSFTAPGLAAAVSRHQLRTNTLSNREYEILRHLRAGETNGAIAREIGVSESTVRTYVSRLYDKLGVHSRRQAVAVATRWGLL
ncbi:MAG: response regulator transcription factor [Hamadaea sp.]|nr:response regulator transcription factor [Hamadaea sp.]